MEDLKKLFPAEISPVIDEFFASYDPTKMMAHEVVGDKIVATFGTAQLNADFINSQWEMREGDVLVASYPKTGTNWTGEIVDRLVYQDEKELKIVKALPIPLRALEMSVPMKFQIIDALPVKRRVFGTHFSVDLLDVKRLLDKKIKIVYVLRNPKDMLVSMFNFLRKLPPFQHEPLKSLLSDWKTFYGHYMNGSFPMAGKKDGKYFDHVLGWLKYRTNSSVHFVFYEDLKKDFQSETKKLASFLETPMSPEKLAEITEKCTISSMRKSYEERPGFESKLAAAFINKGGIGGWKDYFTVAQSEEWDQLQEEQMSNTDVKFQFTI